MSTSFRTLIVSVCAATISERGNFNRRVGEADNFKFLVPGLLDDFRRLNGEHPVFGSQRDHDRAMFVLLLPDVRVDQRDLAANFTVPKFRLFDPEPNQFGSFLGDCLQFVALIFDLGMKIVVPGDHFFLLGKQFADSFIVGNVIVAVATRFVPAQKVQRMRDQAHMSGFRIDLRILPGDFVRTRRRKGDVRLGPARHAGNSSDACQPGRWLSGHGNVRRVW